jgi:hypothetical protein
VDEHRRCGHEEEKWQVLFHGRDTGMKEYALCSSINMPQEAWWEMSKSEQKNQCS